MENLENKIYKSISEQFNVDANNLNEKTSFKEDLNADSLDLVELVMTLESELGIDVSDSDLDAIVTIGDCIEFVKGNKDN